MVIEQVLGVFYIIGYQGTLFVIRRPVVLWVVLVVVKRGSVGILAGSNDPLCGSSGH